MNLTEQNRAFIVGIFDELARDNPVPFRDALSEDVRWNTPGCSVWSREFRGKDAVLNELLGMVRTQLTSRVQLTVERVFADGDCVVVQASGKATTKAGAPYNNAYCMIYRVADGKIAEVTEYLDTQLATARLKAPWAASESA